MDHSAAIHDETAVRLKHAPALVRRLVLVAMVATITLIAQRWIGSETIYSSQYIASRNAMHTYILDNHLPAGTTWTSLGANGLNVRIGVVYLAEGMHRAFGVGVDRAYLILDTAFLAAALLLLFVYLRRWFDDAYSLLGVLMLSATLPLTYALHRFHPWDRPSLLVWIFLLLLLRTGSIGWFAVFLPISALIKYDTVPLPGLFWLATATKDNWQRTTLTTVGLFILSFGAFFGLREALPGGFEPREVVAHVTNNLDVARSMHLGYPPLLGLGVPFLLAIIGFSSADRFARASAIFGCLLLVPLFLQTNFAEFRAEVPVLVLLLPCALFGLRSVLVGAQDYPFPRAAARD